MVLNVFFKPKNYMILSFQVQRVSRQVPEPSKIIFMLASNSTIFISLLSQLISRGDSIYRYLIYTNVEGSMLRTKAVCPRMLECHLAKHTVQGGTNQTSNLDKASQWCKHMVTEQDHQTYALGEFFNPDSQREHSCSDPLPNYPCISVCDLLHR